MLFLQSSWLCAALCCALIAAAAVQAGEMNGKSGNLNNCLTQIYPEGVAVPPSELVCIFDADQVLPCPAHLPACSLAG